MTLKSVSILFIIAYCIIGYFSLSQAQILDENISDSLIHVMLTEDIPDTSRYHLAMDISDYATSPKVGLKYALLALELANKLKRQKWQAAASLNVGQAYKKLGNNEKALSAILESIKYYQTAHSQPGVASAYIALGNVYSQQDNNELAQQYYNQAIGIFREVQDTTRLATAILNAGDLYNDRHQYDSALLAYEEAYRLFEKLQFDVGIAYALGNIGLVKTSQGDFIAGRAHMTEAIIMLKNMGDNYPIAEYMISLAKIYVEKNELNRALDYAQQSWDISRQDELMDQMRNASELLSQLYAEKGDYQKAFQHQSISLTLRDSINNEEVILNMADMRTEFEVEQKQAEIDLLNQTRKNQQLIQYGLFLFSLLIIAIAILLYRNNNFQKKANQQLARQKSELHEKNKALDALMVTREKFLSIISHDLRSPVNAFYGLSGILKDYVEEKQYDLLPEMVTHIEKTSLHLSVLLDNLLSWAVNQQGDIPINPERLQVKEVADEVVGIFQTMALTKDIDLSSRVNGDLYIWVDKNAFFTILRNLINNALKFTPTKGEVAIEAYQEEGKVAVHVRDTGVGMPQEKVDTLFQQKDGERTWGTSGEKGLGIGLQLVYEFVQLSQGSVSVNSREGQGTTFAISLPVFQEKLSMRLK
ncbi:sensor histidine kinase [Catalinimonas niigatensis]|uniref:sensor histidine kinase n=1 Tax=Catalinimonas niigatensis TaxID=1397264 RepID=UPI00266640A4|nr:tetratricopeptide repeat-containing sensor histidine kinase [Catalinimonas niigatensis]WPP53282.1 tetratricopeptide repeat-containing sensor histidine kinase [Catalinimonas niigatensis]